MGSYKERPAQYAGNRFFTVCNYEQVLRDILAIEGVAWDLIILDEGQRIKNWEAKTSRIVKALKSPFALVLSGTPLENRLDELFSVVEFIDDRRLGPAFRFFNRHRVVDEKGKLLGYKNLDRLRETLRPILLRRTRRQVLDELPPRTTEVIRIAPTDEQLDMQKGHRNIVQTIINKKYLSEMDLLRLQKALLMCRMCADSTFLVDKQAPGYSSKLKELGDLLDQLKAEADRKIVLFSEWTTMLNLIEPLLEARKMNYVRLDGSVPQKKRQELIHRFQKDPACMLFINHQRRCHGAEPAGGQYGDQCGSALEPGRTGATHLQGTSHGAAAAGAGLSAGHHRHPGGEPAGHAVGQASALAGGSGSGHRHQSGGDEHGHGRTQTPHGDPVGSPS